MKFLIAALSIFSISQASHAEIEQRPMEPTAAIESKLNESIPSANETRNAVVVLNDELNLNLSSEQVSEIAKSADADLSKSIVELRNSLSDLKLMYLKYGKKISEDKAYSAEIREILLSSISTK